MDVDLFQLPIPSWGLRCPTCDYALEGLPTHRCPECGQPFDMNRLVRTWTRLRDPRWTGAERPMPGLGLRCRGCGVALAGQVGFACEQCGASTRPEDLGPSGEWFVLDEQMAGTIAMPAIEALLARELVPYYHSRDRLVRELYMGPRIVGARFAVPSEFYFEVLRLLQDLRAEMAAARKAPRWTCAACGARVPGNFELCWKCETPR